jgi:hypothetical protein
MRMMTQTAAALLWSHAVRQRLRAIRVARGLSYAAAGALLGGHASLFQTYESNRTASLPLTLLVQMAHAYGVPLACLFEAENAPVPAEARQVIDPEEVAQMLSRRLREVRLARGLGTKRVATLAWGRPQLNSTVCRLESRQNKNINLVQAWAVARACGADLHELLMESTRCSDA